MRYFARILILICSIFATVAHASTWEPFIDGLYWRASETTDWVLSNTSNPANQQITYTSVNFDYDPGLRLGLGYKSAWEAKIYYTTFYTDTTAVAYGNLVATFLGGKLIQGNNFFYRSGELNFKINFNTIDADFAKSFQVSESILIRPIIGVRGGWIYQTIDTNFQGAASIREVVKNNFSGVGPKVAIETEWALHKNSSYKWNIFANATSAFLWGKWKISDVVTDYNNSSNLYVNVGNRNLGAFVLQALFGVGLNYKCLGVKLGYEISDWFDQYQVLDDGTGTRNLDLILQGLTLRLSYVF